MLVRAGLYRVLGGLLFPCSWADSMTDECGWHGPFFLLVRSPPQLLTLTREHKSTSQPNCTSLLCTTLHPSQKKNQQKGKTLCHLIDGRKYKYNILKKIPFSLKICSPEENHPQMGLQIRRGK